MDSHLVTTPFGRRPMSLGMLASQVTAKAVSADTVVHKWHVFHDIREARDVLGVSDRALAILNALLSFHPETAFYGDSNLIVFPSNEQLINRANGISAATLRRHLSVLVQAGLIIRRDSPNGKRYARKSRSGDIETAFGFDLAPIVARAGEIKDMALLVAEEKKALRLVRERLTLCRRDIVKLIASGIAEAVPANWVAIRGHYDAIMARLPRSASRMITQAIVDELEDLWSEIRTLLESFINSQIPSASESQTERHIQNSNPDSISEPEQGFRDLDEASGSAGEKPGNLHALPKRDLPLGIVLDACPNMAWLVKGGGAISNWRDFLSVADLARPVLGISPSAWDDAKTVLGDQQAAITIAAIYQRADAISSPGGYLRSLTDRARAGKFSTWPMIMALLRANLDKERQAG